MGMYVVITVLLYYVVDLPDFLFLYGMPGNYLLHTGMGWVTSNELTSQGLVMCVPSRYVKKLGVSNHQDEGR